MIPPKTVGTVRCLTTRALINRPLDTHRQQATLGVQAGQVVEHHSIVDERVQITDKHTFERANHSVHTRARTHIEQVTYLRLTARMPAIGDDLL